MQRRRLRALARERASWILKSALPGRTEALLLHGEAGPNWTCLLARATDAILAKGGVRDHAFRLAVSGQTRIHSESSARVCPARSALRINRIAQFIGQCHAS